MLLADLREERHSDQSEGAEGLHDFAPQDPASEEFHLGKGRNVSSLRSVNNLTAPSPLPSFTPSHIPWSQCHPLSAALVAGALQGPGASSQPVKKTVNFVKVVAPTPGPFHGASDLPSAPTLDPSAIATPWAQKPEEVPPTGHEPATSDLTGR